MNRYSFGLPVVLSKAVEGIQLERNDIRYLLMLKRGADIDLLHRVARLVRSRYFGYKIFLYGFLCLGTYCRSSCKFCELRSGNSELIRFGKSEEEIIAAAIQLRDSGVHLIELATGEGANMFHPDFGLRRLLGLIERIKSATGLPVMLSSGAVLGKMIPHIAASRAEWCACYQETHSRELFEVLRKGQSYDELMATKLQAKRGGMLIEEGIVAGMGETVEDIVNSIVEMRSMKADQVRVKSFVSQQEAPIASLQDSNHRFEEIIISIMRLVLPGTLIPASLDNEGLAGLQRRLHAGANVVTSITHPGSGVEGRADSPFGIAGSGSTVESVCAGLQCCGMESATAIEYHDWLELRHKANSSGYPERAVNCRYWS